MAELRAALTAHLQKPEAPMDELSALLQRVAREAKDGSLRPEQLLLIFKQLWNSLAESLRPQNPEQFEKVRERLVTVCIKAYYAE